MLATLRLAWTIMAMNWHIPQDRRQLMTAENIAVKRVKCAITLPTSMTDVAGARQAKRGELRNTTSGIRLPLEACALNVKATLRTGMDGRSQQSKVQSVGAHLIRRDGPRMGITATTAATSRQTQIDWLPHAKEYLVTSVDHRVIFFSSHRFSS